MHGKSALQAPPEPSDAALSLAIATNVVLPSLNIPETDPLAHQSTAQHPDHPASSFQVEWPASL